MDVLSVLFHQRSRAISFIIPDVVMSEKHTDALEITEHPVERPTSASEGASASNAAYVADHAYRRPSEVVMEVGFAGGGSLLDASLLDTRRLGLSLGTSPKEVYQQLLDLQQSRLPFDVTTGKRQYKNMLIRTLNVTTDKTSEQVLMAVITLREVIFTQTQTLTVASKENMAQGVGTSAVQNSGTKTPAAVNQSVISKAWDTAAGWFK